MSYCRWSSDDWKCDLYCYADASGGYTTHVANRKFPWWVIIPSLSLRVLLRRPKWLWARLWSWSHWLQMWSLDLVPPRPIGLPHDGESFNDDTLEEFRDRLLHLRAVGYRFPYHVLDMVDAEIKEQS